MSTIHTLERGVRIQASERNESESDKVTSLSTLEPRFQELLEITMDAKARKVWTLKQTLL